MRDYKEVTSRRNFKAGYVLITGVVDGSEFGCDDYTMTHAETPAGDYIGNSKTAYRLCKTRGIAPEKSSRKGNVCSIGFCEKEQKWYGWSHRAIYGFGIGSKVKRGDSAYVPTDRNDFIQEAISFWSSDSHDNVSGQWAVDDDGKDYIAVSWTYSPDIPNEKLRSQISGARYYLNTPFGKGEWTAASLMDAKQMADDFAESVS